MAYQQREGQGSLFKNDKQNDRQPDFRGTILIKGVTYNISAWKRTSQGGRDYISLQAEEKDPNAQPGNYRQNQPNRQPSAYQPAGYQPSGYQPSAYQTPAYQTTGYPSNGPVIPEAPAPSVEDMPQFGDEEDLPF